MTSEEIKRHILIALAKTGLLSKRISIPSDAKIVNLSSNQIEYNYKNTNNLMILSIGGKTFYFRECRRHKKKRQYIQDLINEYCHTTGSDIDREKIMELLQKRSNFRKLWKMGTRDLPTSSISKYFKTKDLGLVGLAGYSSDSQSLDGLLNFIWSEIYAYNLTPWYYEWQTYNANRQLAQYALAKMFGAENLICHTEMIILKIDGECEKFGTLMDFADGIKTNRLSGSELNTILSPALQRDLITLNILDAISYEKDHRPGNYMVKLGTDGKATSLQAYDNDSPLSFLPVASPKMHSYLGSSSVIDTDGGINRPHIDTDFCKNITKVTFKQLYNQVNPYLNNIQLLCVWIRIKKVVSAIRETTRKNEALLLASGEWGYSSVTEELSGRYGKTYLSIFMTANLEQYKAL